MNLKNTVTKNSQDPVIGAMAEHDNTDEIYEGLWLPVGYEKKKIKK